MHARDYNAIALALLRARTFNSTANLANVHRMQGVDLAAVAIANAIAKHDPTFDREDFLKLTRGE